MRINTFLQMEVRNANRTIPHLIQSRERVEVSLESTISLQRIMKLNGSNLQREELPNLLFR